MQKRLFWLMLFVLSGTLISEKGTGAITSIVLTPGNPTMLSTGKAYYLAGKQYTFTVQVIDPAAAAWGDINYVDVTIPSTTSITIRGNAFVGLTCTASVTAGSATVPATFAVAGTPDNFTVTMLVTIRWDTAEQLWGTYAIQADASVTSISSATQNVSYGISSTMYLRNFNLDGEAADFKVNPWHDTFNATGDEIVYNIPGATAADAVHSHADLGAAEITNVAVRINGTTAGNDADETNGISVAVPASFFNTNAIPISTASRTVDFVATCATAPLTKTGSNTLGIICNEIQVTNITVSGGGGTTDPQSPANGYYQSLLVAGTLVTVTATRRSGGGVMEGNTTFVLRDTTDGTLTAIIIPNGSSSNTVAITTAGITVGAGATGQRSYQIVNVYNGAYGSAVGFGQYRTDATYIYQPGHAGGAPLSPPLPGAHAQAQRYIRWDNGDAPSDNGATPFTAYVSETSTASTITLSWTDLLYNNGTKWNGDFYSYRIYYRKQATPPWLWIDRNTVTVPPGIYDLGGSSDLVTINTMGNKVATISGLAPLTTYEYQISAIDRFGNEVALGNYITGDHATQPSSITMVVTDGISTYNDSAFNGDPDPTLNLTLRKTNITVKATIITGGTVADEVKLLLRTNADDVPAQYGAGAVDDLTTDMGNNTSFTMAKTGANEYSVQIPDSHPLIAAGATCRFIIETVYGGSSSYAGHDHESTGRWDNNEWRFTVSTAATFTPWPTRILNNVLDAANPTAYPAYYLSEDASVTIKIYDVKGRPVKTLMENASRKGGQNIKEGGWDGTNKANRKVGVGLYYVHFRAVNGSGKVILNEFLKVVMAH